MKKTVALFFAVLLFAVPIFAEKVYTMDKALTSVADELAAKLPSNTKVVVVEIRSAKQEASDYIVEELTAAFLRTGKLVVVDRQNLDKIKAELSFQASGDVSDESAQKLGAMLGAETLVSGTFDLLNDKYRMVIKAVKVETSEIQSLSTMYVSSSAETEALFGNKTGTAAAVATVGSAARNVLDFSGRFICMCVNPVVGIGSFMQGDTSGGSRVVFFEVAGIATMAYGSYRENNNHTNGKLFSGLGGCVFAGSIVYSLIRPWTYNRNPKVAETLDHVNVTYTADKDLSLGYTVRY